jgi:tetratricopeptide (TPR) repeat protein
MRSGARRLTCARSLFTLGLLAKTVTAILPAVLLAVFWWKRGRIDWRRDVRPFMPFFVLGLSIGIVTAWFERTLNGARGVEFQLAPMDRVLIAGRAIWFYLSKLAWPFNLMFIYPRWTIDAVAWQQYVYPVAVLVLLASSWFVRRWSRAPFAAMLIFCVTVAPALGFVDVYPFRYSYVADHFQYLASMAIFALFAGTVIGWIARASRDAGRAEIALCCVIGAPLGALTWIQSREYVDERTLYEATLERNPGCWLCHNNLATPKLQGSPADLAEAVGHLRESLRLNPNDAEAHNNMGGVFQRMGKFEEAIEEHQEALPLNPQLVEARYNIGVCDQALNRMEEARTQYAEAIRAQPDYAMAHYNLGTTLTAIGRLDEAEAEFKEALRLTPEFALAHDGLGFVLLRSGRIPDAVTEFKNATRIQPGYAPAHYKLGVTLAGAGLSEEALEEFRDAVRYAPASPEMHIALAATLASTGRLSDAEFEFGEALRLRVVGQFEITPA